MKFEVLEPKYKEYAVTGYGFSGNAAKDGIEAGFEYLEALGEIELSSVRGKIVYMNGGIGDETFKKLIEAGVVGVVTPSGTYFDKTTDSDIDERMLRPRHLENGVLPAVCMRIKDACGMLESKPTRVRLTLEQEEGEADSHNVIAEIKGTEKPDEVVIYTAHYDSVVYSHGMFDNASGTAMILEMLRYYKAHPPKRTVRFVWCGSEERGLLGSKAYIAAHEADLAGIRLCVNIDMVGTLLGHDDYRIIGTEDFVHAVQFLYKKVGYPMSVRQDIYSSDCIPFADKGIPAINIIRSCPQGGSQIHCRRDIIDIMSAESFEKTCNFLALFSDEVVNSVFFPIERKIPDNMVEKIDKYLRKKK
ncbi:MAG: M28 family metallopeptidase [Clostridia bacterium]|nr:M28 family metallopeptidase [Clostridia bacterium]